MRTIDRLFNERHGDFITDSSSREVNDTLYYEILHSLTIIVHDHVGHAVHRQVLEAFVFDTSTINTVQTML